MKNLLLFLLVVGASCHHPARAADPAKVAGKWQLVLSTPHGTIDGMLDLKQDGSNLSGSCETDRMGTIALSGTVDAKNVGIGMELHGMAFKLVGSVEGAKMSGTTDPEGGTWSATRNGTAAASRTILGSLSAIDPAKLEYTVKPDSGAPQRFRVGSETQVVQVAPGEHDLSRAKPARITDIAIGDRVLVSFVEGLAEARRIVLVSADDIAKRNETEKLDWQRRGVTGIVRSKNAGEVAIESRTFQGVQETTVLVTAKTKVRRYAPDSVSFAAALPATVDAVEPGDQFHARGERSADGARLVADEVVFGTFLTKVATIVSVDTAARRVRLTDLVTKAPLTVKIGPESQLKTMAAARPAAGGHEPSTPGDLARMLQRMPAGRLEDLKPGGAVVVTATRGSRPDEVTAIMLLADIDPLIEMARAQAARDGVSLVDAMAGMHRGIMSGPGGLTLPAILQ